MKSGDLATGCGRLHDALVTLRAHWQATADAWQDVKRQEFEDNHLAPLDVEVAGMIKKIERLSQVFHEARQACS